MGFLRRVKAATVMGVVWALAWAPVAVLVGTQVIDPENRMDEMWFMIGALPGFLCGVLFSFVLGVMGRTRRFADLSVPRFALWGALAGLALGFAVANAGTPAAGSPAWLMPVVTAIFALVSGASAAASLVLARKGEPPALGAGGDDDVAALEREFAKRESARDRIDAGR